MQISSPRLRRLDGALADLPAESEAMLLSELDGYVAGVIVCPDMIPPGEWLPPVLGQDGGPWPFEDEREAQWYAALVTEHHAAVTATLAKRAGRYRPFLEVDVRHGEVLWELWIEGFAAAMGLRPESWQALAGSADADVAEAFAGLATLVEIARDESSLERRTIDALTDEAPGSIPGWIERLYGRAGAGGGPAIAAPPPAKIGRNEPCPCGSGRKSKKCCG